MTNPWTPSHTRPWSFCLHFSPSLPGIPRWLRITNSLSTNYWSVPFSHNAAPVWSNTSNTNYRHPQTLQSKCLRVIGNNPKRTPIHFLHSSLHIEPLYEFIHRLSEKFFHQCSIHHNPLVRQTGDYTIVDLQHQYKKYIHKRTKHLLL